MEKINVKFVDYDGYLYEDIFKDVDEPFIEDIQVAPIVDIYETKRFSRWNKDIDTLKEDCIVHAVYETIYPFVFKEINGHMYLVDTDSRCMNTMYVIPEQYADKKVYGILAGAFKNISANAASIFIPKNVKDIQDGAFDCCYNTTFVFEARQNDAGYRKSCANFEAKVYFNATAKNHFVSDEFEFVIKNHKAYVIRCLECYGASVVPDKIRQDGELYDVAGIDEFAFYSPFCSDFYEIYVPSYMDTDDLNIAYITNSELIKY